MNNIIRNVDFGHKTTNNKEKKYNFSDGGGGSDMEARIAKLESDVNHIQSDINEIKLDIRELKSDIKKDNNSTNSRLSNLEKLVSNLKYWIIGVSAAMSVVIVLIQLGILNISK